MQGMSIHQLISEMSGPPVLWDTGLINRMIPITDFRDSDIPRTPLPTALVAVFSPAHKVARHRRTRARPDDLRFCALDREVQGRYVLSSNRRVGQCARFYERLGVPVIYLDGSQPVAGNLSRLQAFLREMPPRDAAMRRPSIEQQAV